MLRCEIREGSWSLANDDMEKFETHMDNFEVLAGHRT